MGKCAEGREFPPMSFPTWTYMYSVSSNGISFSNHPPLHFTSHELCSLLIIFRGIRTYPGAIIYHIRQRTRAPPFTSIEPLRMYEMTYIYIREQQRQPRGKLGEVRVRCCYRAGVATSRSVRQHGRLSITHMCHEIRPVRVLCRHKSCVFSALVTYPSAR